VLRSWRLLGMFTRVDHEAARHGALESLPMSAPPQVLMTSDDL
jgi:hypothetical protein